MVISWIRNLIRRPSRGGPARCARSASRKGRNRSARRSNAWKARVVPAFLAPVSYAAGAAPTAIAVGDFNGDGQPDIVTVNSTSVGTVSVLLGNGDGTFQAADQLRRRHRPDPARRSATSTATASSTSPSSAATTSIAQHPEGQRRRHLPGPGAVPTRRHRRPTSRVGGLQQRRPPRPRHVDHRLRRDGDGPHEPRRRHLRPADQPRRRRQRRWTSRSATSTTTASRTSSSPTSSAAARSACCWATATAPSSPPAATAAGSAPYKIVLGDFNHDGNLDIVALNSYTSNSMSVLLGNGDGTFRPPTTYNLGRPAQRRAGGGLQRRRQPRPHRADRRGLPGRVGRGDGSFYAATTTPPSTGSAHRGRRLQRRRRRRRGHSSADRHGGRARSTRTTPSTNLAGAVGLQRRRAGRPPSPGSRSGDGHRRRRERQPRHRLHRHGRHHQRRRRRVTQPLSYTFTAADAGTHTFTTA